MRGRSPENRNEGNLEEEAGADNWGPKPTPNRPASSQESPALGRLWRRLRRRVGEVVARFVIMTDVVLSSHFAASDHSPLFIPPWKNGHGDR